MIPLSAIQEAANLLKDKVIRTPLVYSPTFSEMTGSQVYLKLENLQRGGSFKIRGATNKIFTEEIPPGGVVAASAGNHAQGVALAARAAGLPATIVMPVWVSITKQEATRGYGAEVILKGDTLAESITTARELALSGRTFVHPYDDPKIIAGQGTIGLEIVEDLPDVDYVLVPVGGGGLISGIALAVKALRPEARVVGVQASACPSAYEAKRDGMAVCVVPRRSIAEAIRVTQVGEIPFRVMGDEVDDIVLVEEEQIVEAVSMLLERKKVLAEGAGAVPLAALLGPALDIPRGSKVVLVISGGNVDSLLLDRIIRQGLLLHGRVMRFSVVIEDVPGSMARLMDLVAGLEANVLHIYHVRSGRDLPIQATRVYLELETRGQDHALEITEGLKAEGYDVVVR